jgi:20S proteasome alpha/beta subunit
MTICIAANCAHGEAVVVASDRMLTAHFLALEFDHPDAKIEEISPTCVALTSGDALAAQGVLAAGPGIAGQLQDPFISDFAEHIRQKYVESRRKMANQGILEPRGMTFDNFYSGGINNLPRDLAMLLDSHIQRADLGVSIILAGVDRAGPHIYGIEDPGTSICFDRLSYHAIGSGDRHAILTLVAQKQHHTMGLNQTVFNAYCAKRAAEAAPGVGTETEMRVITRTGIHSVTAGELDALSGLHKKRMNPKLDEVDKGVKELPYEQGSKDGKAKGRSKSGGAA